MTNTSWDKAKIVALLTENDKAVGRALVRLWERQTYDEQTHKDVKYRNNQGFRPCHARLGTEMALYFKSQGQLTLAQARWWRVRDKKGNMRIGIYANQLLKLVK